jgi:hypothetical protein
MGKRKPETFDLALDDDVRKSARQATSMILPLAVHQRLQALAELPKLTDPTRAEVICMLIAEMPLDQKELDARILAYREKTVGEVLPKQPNEHLKPVEGGRVVHIEGPRPGRPSSRRAG